MNYFLLLRGINRIHREEDFEECAIKSHSGKELHWLEAVSAFVNLKVNQYTFWKRNFLFERGRTSFCCATKYTKIRDELFQTFVQLKFFRKMFSCCIVWHLVEVNLLSFTPESSKNNVIWESVAD